MLNDNIIFKFDNYAFSHKYQNEYIHYSELYKDTF